VLGILVLALVAWLTRSAPVAPPSAGPPPNILLVSIDSLRADHLHSYGYARETSPTIDTLARDGVLFRHAVAPATWTLPSHMTMLTGMPPELHGVTTNERRLAPEAVTLAEVLRDAGYATAGFAAAPYVRSMYGFDQGFDLYDESIVADGLLDSLTGLTSPESTRLVTGYLESWDAGGRQKPFFVFLHLWDVHYDYNPPPPYDTMFDPDYVGPVTGRNFLLDPHVKPGMDPRDLAHVRALYDGEIRYTDEHLGKIVALLERMGVLDDTIVVVTSDHGEEFFEHGRKGHGEVLYDETLLVPLVLRFPRAIAAGKVVTEQARMMDLAPTLLELAGVAAPSGFGTPEGTPDGALSLARYVAPGARASPPPLAAHSTTTMGKTTRTSVRTQDAKLVVRAPGPPQPELYDLARDAGERSNLAKSDDAHELLGVLEGDLATWRSSWSGQKQLASVLEVPSDQRDRLRALGYVE